MKFKKDPDAVLDYIIDFAALSNGRGKEDYLQAGETIRSIDVFSSSPDLVVTQSYLTDTDTSVTLWLSGGVEEAVYTVTCRIETTMDRIDDRSIQIYVVQR